MKKILIGTLVGGIIYFMMQSLMWMSGIHNDFSSYTKNHEAILNCLNQNLTEDGLYMMPTVDPASPTAEEDSEKLHKEMEGKPWAFVFYHKSMDGGMTKMMLTGLLWSLIAALIASFVLFHGGFETFYTRFLVSMSFALFCLSQGVLDDMNWWAYPWNFVKAEVIDIVVGWGVCSVWLAWYLKK